MTCRHEAGPEPYSTAGMAFGLVGALAMESTPQWQAWNQQVASCVKLHQQADVLPSKPDNMVKPDAN